MKGIIKLILAIFTIAISLNCVAQDVFYLNPNAPGYRYKRLLIDSALRVPKKYNLKQQDSNSIALDHGFIIYWDGIKWDTASAKGSGGGGGGIDTVAHGLTLKGKGISSSKLEVDTNYLATRNYVDTLSLNMQNIGTATGAVGFFSPLSNKYTAKYKKIYSSDNAFQFTNVNDSLVNATALNVYKRGGNSFGANGIIGTNDNYPFIFNQNGVERERLAATTGNHLINTTSDNGTDKLQVNGSASAKFLTLHSEGIGNTEDYNFNLTRSESGTTFGLLIGTNYFYGSSAIYFRTDVPISFGTPLASFSGSTYVENGITTGGGLLFSGRAAIASNDKEGLDFISGWYTTGRDATKPILKIGNDGQVKISTYPTTTDIDNYAAALDIQSTSGGFLPPRMTTAERDSLTGIFAYKVTNGGSGYVSPTATITGGGGTGATANVEISAGTITKIFATTHGVGYTSQPTITITDSGGTGATAVAKLGILAEGLTIYNLTTHKMQVWNGSSWNDLY
ncbi:hypothetical protein [Pinibacter soli]|uniref:T9SS C-terminal target domain-containing protein n=1 Tax=Pinibacter soli TaxID=3044211 RepID=A0ABT6RBR7_9BACT|nr:hypothetical protein [Pinibacter soli]MDI3320004.1 hypothetical protein [Pinibacter soli]